MFNPISDVIKSLITRPLELPLHVLLVMPFNSYLKVIVSKVTSVKKFMVSRINWLVTRRVPWCGFLFRDLNENHVLCPSTISILKIIS